MENRIKQLNDLIASNADYINFGTPVNSVSDSLIAYAEELLSVSFPKSYVWWLKNYVGGEIYGEEIYSVYSNSGDKNIQASGDIVYVNTLFREQFHFEYQKIVISVTDRGEIFYFDTGFNEIDNEYPIFRKFGNNIEKYAFDFLGFIEKRIKEFST